MGWNEDTECTHETRSPWASRLFWGKLMLLLLLGCKTLPESSSWNDHHPSYHRVQALPPNNQVHMCAYSSCKAETPFQQWRWTTSVVCSSGTTAEQVCPIPITTRKLEFGPGWDSSDHTLTRKMDQHLHVTCNFKHSHQKYHCYKQKSKGWIATNDCWTPKHVETPPFTQTVHHRASCVTPAGVVATLYSHFNDVVLVLWHHYAHTVFVRPVVSLFYSYPSWP